VRYRSIFENSPIALWELNASELKHNLDALKDNGIKDFNNYFDKHPDEFTACTSMVKIVDVNNTAVRMYEAKSKEILKHNLDTVFSDERLAVFRNSIVRRMDGQFLNFDEIKQKTLTGKNLNVLIHSSLPEEFKDIQNSMASILDLDELLMKAMKTMKDILGYNENSIWLKDGKEMVLKAASFKAVQDKIGKLRLKIGSKGIIGKVAETRRLYNSPDVLKDPYYTVYAENVKTKSECAVPIKTKNKPIGVL